MDRQELKKRIGFWALALLWLPAGVIATAVVRFGGDSAFWTSLPLAMASLVPVAPCGLPLALGCRWLLRLGYRRDAWTAGVLLGTVTVATSLVAGLLGPVAIALFAVVLSLPVWAAAWWLARRG